MTDTVDRDMPEFHIVVKRPNRRGPLAPYRMTLAVVFALALAGDDLWSAAQGTTEVDAALTRAGVAGLFMWVVSGFVNKILATGRPPATTSPSDG